MTEFPLTGIWFYDRYTPAEVHAHRAGRVTELSVAAGQSVKTGQVICVVTAD